MSPRTLNAMAALAVVNGGGRAPAEIGEPLGEGDALERLVPQQFACEVFGLSPSFFEQDRLRPTPRIPFVKFGRSVRYRLSDLRAYVAANMVGSKSAA